jgi:hypothetical protein
MEKENRRYVSPEERAVMASIKDRLDVANSCVQKENYGLAKRCYSDAAKLYEQIGDDVHAREIRDLASKVGTGISTFKKESHSRVYSLGPGLASAVSVFAIAFGALIVLPQITGNVIGNANVGMSLAGVLIFIAGVLGLYSSIKKDEKK